MNFETYQTLSSRTLDMSLSTQHALTNYTLGLVGETTEFYTTTNVLDEAGDLTWYVAALCTTIGVDFAAVATLHENLAHRYRSSSRDEVFLRLAVCAGVVAELVKKHAFHAQPIAVAAVVEHLGEFIGRLFVWLEERGHDVAYVLERNVDKLTRRYPLGFVHGGGVR